MQEPAKITCPNCQTPNPETNRFCQQCRALVPKQYLWAIGESIAALKPGQLVAERYQLKRDRIVLDTQPNLLPEFPTEVPEDILPYLRLMPYRLHVPQIYGFVTLGGRGKRDKIWLLEKAAISLDWAQGKEPKIQLLPELTRVWPEATPMRQLNWLWQMAQLWQPFSSAGVASSLLNPQLLRVEGSLVRCLELNPDRATPTLSQLGQQWREWLPGAKPSIAEFLTQLCQQMVEEELSPQQVVAQLELALAQCARSLSYTYQIVTRTDTGPSRQRNEDACYPPPNTTGNAARATQSPTSLSKALAIVCDGIGGHEGGNVASSLAIETIGQHFQQQLSDDQLWNPSNLETELELAVCAANDSISQRNDAEQRQQRQRMGTTLVMATGHGHEIYITHVGDSRAYWISRRGCHQVTLDDDVASREVRLGYSLYREALQQMGSGSLIQALGMGSSGNLHPSVQRFVLDEDGIFLLCTDGLSDNDRVEEYWESEIMPILAGKMNLATAASRLIELGNTLNGHDNVTVALVYCQVRASGSTSGLLGLNVGNLMPSISSPTTNRPSVSQKTQLLVSQKRQSNSLLLLLAILLVLGLGGLLAYLLVPSVSSWVDGLMADARRHLPTGTATPTPIIKPIESGSLPLLSPGSFIQVKSLTPTAVSQSKPIKLFGQPETTQNIQSTGSKEGIIPSGTIVQIVSRQAKSGQGAWVQLKICSLPALAANTGVPESVARQDPSPPSTGIKPPTGSLRLLQPGETGWMRETELSSFVLSKVTLAREQQGKCQAQSGNSAPGANL